MIHRVILSLLALSFLILVVALVGSGILLRNYVTTFLTSSGLTLPSIHTTLTNIVSPLPTTTILFMGLDQRADALETTLLTDAMLLASYNPKTATAFLIPLPRDLWLPDLRTKINALYYYGTKNGQGADYVTTHISHLTGQTIPYYVIIDYLRLPQAIDLVGGIDVVVKTTFTDTQFPNPAHITDPAQPTYITITFAAGPTHMSGHTALTFMRSRHSENILEGSDEARSARQLLVFQAVVKQLTSRDLLANPALLGQLYRFYHTSIITNLTDANLVSLALASFPNQHITLQPVSIQHLLTSPPLRKYGQWVWELRDTSGKSFQDFIASTLN